MKLEFFTVQQIMALLALLIVFVELMVYVVLQRNENLHQEDEEADEYGLFSLADYMDEAFMPEKVKCRWRAAFVIVSVLTVSCWIGEVSAWRLAWLYLGALILSWYIVPTMSFVFQFLYDVVLTVIIAVSSVKILVYEQILQIKRKFFL